jgi:hypothetical protein
MSNSVIRTINDEGKISENASYSQNPFEALICYLEQTINKNFKTWEYFADNRIDAAGREYNTKSKFIPLVKELPSKKGYGYFVPGTNTAICAYEQ